MASDLTGRLPGRRTSGDRRVVALGLREALSRSSERPRDALGRPLDPGDPRSFPTVPERTFIEGSIAWSEGLRYLADGLPFHAHEVFEQRWKCAPMDERDCWQALAQWGAALTQQARGNDIGRHRIAQRATERLERARDFATIPDYVDAEMVLDSLAQLT